MATAGTVAGKIASMWAGKSLAMQQPTKWCFPELHRKAGLRKIRYRLWTPYGVHECALI